jgi:hypothetical protein
MSDALSLMRLTPSGMLTGRSSIGVIASGRPCASRVRVGTKEERAGDFIKPVCKGRAQIGFCDDTRRKLTRILRGTIRLDRERRLKSPSCRNKRTRANLRDFERYVHHVAAELKNRILGAHHNAELRFQLSGDSVERPKRVDGENGGIAVSLDLRNLRGLRRRGRGDRDEYRECLDYISEAPMSEQQGLDSGRTWAVPMSVSAATVARPPSPNTSPLRHCSLTSVPPIRMILCGAKASALPPGLCPAFPSEAIGCYFLPGP